MNSRQLGRWGEELAADYLRQRGFSVNAMNYMTRFGEIDIIASNREYIVFAEVKLRKSERFAAAREFVTRRKQERISITAQLYLGDSPTTLQPRFDVIEVYAPYGEATRRPRISHIENAF